MGAAWVAFLEPVTRAWSPWLRVVEARGADATRDIYLRLLENRAAPADGHVLRL
jgi:hypothetical protein